MSNKQSIGEYLSTLKQGDTVYRKADGANLDRALIAKTTPTQIILTSGGRYNKTTGLSIGGSTWSRSCIVEPTPEVKQEWEALYLAKWASESLPDLFKSLTQEQQRELYRQVKTMTAENKAADSQTSMDVEVSSRDN